VFPLHNGCNRSLVANFRPVRLTLLVCKQMEQIIEYVRQVWDTNDWLYVGQLGFILLPPLFLPYVNDICRNTVSTIRLFADDCVIYRKIINNGYIENFQKYQDKLE
jgi:hypothetical protein